MRKTLISLVIILSLISYLFLVKEDEKKNIIKENKINSVNLNCQDELCFENELNKINSTEDKIIKFSFLSKKYNGMLGFCNKIGRQLGNNIAKEKGEQSLNYRLDDCGHAVTYGILEGLGIQEVSEEKVKEYCLSDSNVPSCTYGVGLFLKEKDIDVASSICNNLFLEYDNSKPPTKSFQMSARGDCFYGFLSTRDEPISNIGKLKEICDKIKINDENGYTKICYGILGYNFLSGSKDKEDLDGRLLKLKVRCLSNKEFECMQFLGKNTIQSYYYILKLKSINDLSDAINKFCEMSNPCVEGSIQSHIVHTSHEEMLEICNLIKNKDFCELTTREHV